MECKSKFLFLVVSLNSKTNNILCEIHLSKFSVMKIVIITISRNTLRNNRILNNKKKKISESRTMFKFFHKVGMVVDSPCCSQLMEMYLEGFAFS